MAEQQIIADAPPVIKTITNPLVAILGINDYHQNSHWSNLPGVIADVDKSIELWSKYFCYDTTVLANASREEKAPNKTKRTKILCEDIFNFMLENIRKPLPNYDALIFMIFGHGANDALITSDCTPLYYDEIKSFFDAKQVGKQWAAHHMRLFIIDTCRGHKYTMALDGVRGRPYNPKSVNQDSNICTYFATTKDHMISDFNLFTNTIDSIMRNTNLSEYTLYDIITKIAEGIDSRSSSWYCPEFVSTNKFKIKLKRKTSVEEGKVTYFELKKLKKKIEVQKWRKLDHDKLQSDIEPDTSLFWEWLKNLVLKYGKYLALIMAFALFYYAGQMRQNSNWKFVFPFKSPIEFK